MGGNPDRLPGAGHSRPIHSDVARNQGRLMMKRRVSPEKVRKATGNPTRQYSSMPVTIIGNCSVSIEIGFRENVTLQEME